MSEYKKPCIVVVLDGFGYRKEQAYNAIQLAHMPTYHMLEQLYPHCLLDASGTAVGLLPNQPGNSEVGHLTIGAGRVIEQDISRIHKAIDNGSFFENQILINAFEKLAKTKQPLHCLGLLSDAGVHSHEKHLYAFLKAAEQYNIKNIIVHPFLDGRDTPPQSAMHYLTTLQTYCDKHQNIQIGSLHGRFYAMDRDQHWQRTCASYAALTEYQERKFSTWQKAVEQYYNQGITDEFIPPTQLENFVPIQSGDGILFFNIRPDRIRQLTACFVQSDFTYCTQKKINPLWVMTSIKYSSQLSTISLFEEIQIPNTLKDVLSQYGKTIFSCAETEKYAHVTYFFNGMREEAVKNETRLLIPSLPTKDYVQNPCMSAPDITQAVLNSLEKDPHDFYLINYANPDMVGHSGNLQATIQAVECVDAQLTILYKIAVEQHNATLIIVGDHGKAEELWDTKVQQPKTAHTTARVPLIVVDQKFKNKNQRLELKTLTNIAPYILRLLQLPIPKEMQ